MVRMKGKYFIFKRKFTFIPHTNTFFKKENKILTFTYKVSLSSPLTFYKLKKLMNNLFSQE